MCGCALWDFVPIMSLPGAPSPHLQGLREGTPTLLTQRRDRKSSCSTKYHLILGRQWCMGAGNVLTVPRMGFVPARIMLLAAHSWENHGTPHDEHLVPIFLWRCGSERVHRSMQVTRLRHNVAIKHFHLYEGKPSPR